MALFVPTKFTADYLSELDITVIGLQMHVLALYTKLHAQYAPNMTTSDAKMDARLSTLENTVKSQELQIHALQVSVLEQQNTNKLQQERFDGIMSMLHLHLECQNKKYGELQKTIQKERSTIDGQVKALRKQK